MNKEFNNTYCKTLNNEEISFTCSFNSVKDFPKAMREKETLARKGIVEKSYFAFKTLIYDIPLDDQHDYNNWPKTFFIIIAANQTGLKNMFKLVSLVDTMTSFALDPSNVMNNSEGLLFAKEIIDSNTREKHWDVRKESIDSDEVIAKLSGFNSTELSKIDYLIDDVNLISQIRGSCGIHWPKVKDADKRLIADCYDKAHSIYGDILPAAVEDRLSKELDAIIKNGYAIIFHIAQKLVKRAETEGILVSYRGSAGSSLAAYMAGITEFNPLKPHYICPECHHFELPDNPSLFKIWLDIHEKKCPICGSEMHRTGYDLPSEIFLGEKYDREPDIDILVDAACQKKVIDYLGEWFGKNNIFRARLENDFNAEDRVNGIFILQEDEDILDFTPIETPSNSETSVIPTTHFHYTELDQHLLKQDIIGSKALQLLKMLQDRTGVDPKNIPLDDGKTISMFSTPGEFGYNKTIEDIDIGIIGIPYFDDEKTVDILFAVKPASLSDLIRVIGLSNGIDTWENNADKLIREQKCSIKEVVTSREDLFDYLTIRKGITSENAYEIVNKVRIGRELNKAQLSLMREHSIPEWYIDSISKITFLWSRSWAVSKAVIAYRLAWYKLNYPTIFYSVWLACYAPEFSHEYFLQNVSDLEKTIKDLEETKNNGRELVRMEEEMLRVNKLLCDIYKRGYLFEESVCNLGEEIPDEDIPFPIEQEQYEIIAKWVDEILGCFSEEEQKALKYRYKHHDPDTHSVKETAKKFGISESRVRYLEAKAARLIKQSRFIEKHSKSPLTWDFNANRLKTLSNEEYEEMISYEYDLLPGLIDCEFSDPIDTEDTLDLTKLLRDYVVNVDHKKMLKTDRDRMTDNINFHIAPIKSVSEDFRRDCGYIIINSDNQYNKMLIHSNVLLLTFADTEDRTRWDSISADDACRILFFIDNCTFNDIFVSCDAGESRSPAVVAAILKIAGEEDDYIWKSNDYRPNVNVYHTMLGSFSQLSNVDKEIKIIESMSPEEYREYRKKL